MAGFLRRLRNDASEARAMMKFSERPISERPVVVYAEDDYSWNQLEGYVESLTVDHDIPVTYITSEVNDPIVENPPTNVTPIVLTTQLPIVFHKIDSPVTLTTMPDLDQMGVKRPRDTKLFYSFHSLNSIHMSYRESSFDAYDAFFCTGPYQVDELAGRFKAIGREGVDLHEVGYYKLDRLRAMVERSDETIKPRPLILIAPSWGTSNVLEGYGSETISAVADMDVDVIIRPHPAMFESVYPAGEQIFDRLRAEFADRPNVVFERSITSEKSLIEADLLISDWSGVAFEYAYSTERPVVFLDTPRKEKNPNWRDSGITPFEDRVRADVGEIVEPGNGQALHAAIEHMLDDRDSYRDRIVDSRDREIYNFGSAAAVGASIIAAEVAIGG